MAADKTSNKGRVLSTMTTRQKMIGAVLVVILIIVLWQVYGLFKGKGKIVSPPPPKKTSMVAPGSATTSPASLPPPAFTTPQPAQLPQQPIVSQREAELIQLQQETQAKYLTALNELQMLKITREIAETNQAIVSAKLATVTAEKRIVDLLAPPAPVPSASYAKSLVMPVSSGSVPVPAAAPEVNYSVISVSELEYKWGAVLGYQGRLYNVSVGDILPPDGSKVVSINKTGVILEKDNIRKKVSLVPII